MQDLFSIYKLKVPTENDTAYDMAESAVKRDMDTGLKFGVDGTPTLFYCSPDGKVFKLKSKEAVLEFIK